MPMDSISMCSITLNVSHMDGCGKQFEVAVSINHDKNASFQLHK
jgi:hypothetical protein